VLVSLFSVDFLMRLRFALRAAGTLAGKSVVTTVGLGLVASGILNFKNAKRSRASSVASPLVRVPRMSKKMSHLGDDPFAFVPHAEK
jgi:hypothetical protein